MTLDRHRIRVVDNRTAPGTPGTGTVYRSGGVHRWRPARANGRLFARMPRWLRYALVAVAVLAGAVTSVGVGFASAVTLPDDPVVAQASVLYYRDGRTVLARVGANDRTDVPLSRVPLAVRRAVLA